jgi:serine/threonine-protein kinase
MSTLPKKVGSLTLMRELPASGVTASYVGILDEPAGKQVAVHQVLPELVSGPIGDVGMRVGDLSAVRHPALVTVLDHQQIQGSLWVIEEWAETIDLRRVLNWCRDNRATIPHNIFLDLATQVCNGLEALHGRPGKASNAENVLHLALRLEAIRLTAEGKVLLGSFGLVPTPVGSPAESRTELHYLAPEQTRPGQKLTPATDVFALGAVLFELLTGKPLFLQKSGPQTLHAVRAADVTGSLAQVKAALPGLDKVLYRALSLNPRHRYQRAFVLREDIRGLMAGFTFKDIADETRAFLAPMFAERPAGHQRKAPGPTLMPDDSTAALLISSLRDAASNDWEGDEAPTNAVAAPNSTAAFLRPGRNTLVPDEPWDPAALTGETASPVDLDGPTISGRETSWFPIPPPDAPMLEDPPVEEEGTEWDRGPGSEWDKGPAPLGDQTAWVQRPPAAHRSPAPPPLPSIDPAEFDDDHATDVRADPLPGSFGTPQPAPLAAAPPPPAPRPVSRQTPPPATPAAPVAGRPQQASPVPLSRALDPEPAPRPPPPPVVVVDDDDDDLDWRPKRRGGGLLIAGVAAVVLLVGIGGVAVIGGALAVGLLGGSGSIAQNSPPPAPSPAPSVVDTVAPDDGEQPGDQDGTADAAAPAAAPAAPRPAPTRAQPSTERSPSSSGSTARSTSSRSTSSNNSGTRSTSSNTSETRSSPSSPPPSESRVAASHTRPRPSATPEIAAVLDDLDLEPAPLSTASLDSELDVEPEMSAPPPPGERDLASLSSVSQRGDLTDGDRLGLEMTEPTDPDYTRAHVILYQDARARGDWRSRKKYLDAVMVLPENQYKPEFLVEQAQLDIDAKNYRKALDRANTAERHWARLPRKLIFARKAMIFETQAAAWQGIFYDSGGDDMEALRHSISAWEKYRRHVDSRSRNDLSTIADKQLAKLQDAKRRLE